jgi:signal transduction histidine kinase
LTRPTEANARRGDRDGARTSALRDAGAVLLAPGDAIARQLELLARLGGLREVSLWTADRQGSPRSQGSARGHPSNGVRAAAARALRGNETPPGPRRSIVARPVGPAEAPLGALAARASPGGSEAALVLLGEAAPLLACVLERRDLLQARQAQGEMILATERRLARFGLDLHDGPLQEAAALLSDMRRLAGQLGSEGMGHPMTEIIRGRIQDLEARAIELEADIRELARTAGGPAQLAGSLVTALRSEAQAFGRATGVMPRLEVSGPVDAATASQRITLLRGVQEALRNARRHGTGAKSVAVVVVALPGRLEATITDDGPGFDVKRALTRSRHEGRIGLAGIDQRARLLGGSSAVRSKPGGPTSVTIRLPRWEEHDSEPPAAE